MSEPVTSEVALLRSLGSPLLARALQVMATLGLADRLGDEPRPVEELARACGVDAGALARLLRFLALHGVLEDCGGGTFTLAPLARALRSDHPQSVRPLLDLAEEGRSDWWVFGELLSSVRTGRPAFDAIYGTDFWTMLQRNPDMRREFTEKMERRTSRLLDEAMLAYDWGDVETVIDVGGGNGSLLAVILARHTHLRGGVYDLPEVVKEAEAALARSGAGGRVRCIAGSFFDSVPAGADRYLLTSILHDWDDDRARVILSNCRMAIEGSDGRVLVSELLVDGDDPREAATTDLKMMLMFGGRERTRAELERLLDRAGLSIAAVSPARGGMHLIEAVAT